MGAELYDDQDTFRFESDCMLAVLKVQDKQIWAIRIQNDTRGSSPALSFAQEPYMYANTSCLRNPLSFGLSRTVMHSAAAVTT